MGDSPSDLTRGDLAQAAVSGARWSGIARLAVEVTAFGASVVLARLISPAEFGRAAVAMIVVAIAMVLGRSALGTAIVQMRDVRPAHMESAAFISIGVGFVLTVAVFLIGPVVSDALFDPRTGVLIQLASPAFLLAGVSAIPGAVLERRLQFRRAGAIEVFSLVAAAAASVVLAAAADLEGAAIVLGQLFGMGVSTGALLLAVPFVVPRWRSGVNREMIGFGGAAAASTVLWLSYRNVDYAILAARLQASQVGFYWRAYQLGVEYQNKVTGILMRVAFPVYARAASMEDVLAIRERIVRVQVAIVLPFLAAFIAIAPDLIPWLYGEAWEPAVVPAQILTIAGMLASVMAGVGPLLLGAGRTRVLVALNAYSLVVYSAMIFIVAPYGLNAVCVSVVAFGFVTLIGLQYFVLRPIFGIGIKQLWLDTAPAVCSIIALLAVALPATWALRQADARPAWIVLSATLLGGVAYATTLRFAFPRMWSELRILGARFAGSRKSAKPDPATGLTEPVVPDRHPARLGEDE